MGTGTPRSSALSKRTTQVSAFVGIVSPCSNSFQVKARRICEAHGGNFQSSTFRSHSCNTGEGSVSHRGCPMHWQQIDVPSGTMSRDAAAFPAAMARWHSACRSTPGRPGLGDATPVLFPGCVLLCPVPPERAQEGSCARRRALMNNFTLNL